MKTVLKSHRCPVSGHVLTRSHTDRKGALASSEFWSNLGYTYRWFRAQLTLCPTSFPHLQNYRLLQAQSTISPQDRCNSWKYFIWPTRYFYKLRHFIFKCIFPNHVFKASNHQKPRVLLPTWQISAKLRNNNLFRQGMFSPVHLSPITYCPMSRLRHTLQRL